VNLTGSRPRGKRAYIWATWITGLLATTNKCQWSAWFRAHYYYEKTPERPGAGLQLAQWKREHDDMVAAREKLLRRDGWAVTVEGENAFKLEGRLATLAGKPDLVAVREQVARVIDQKSGDAKDEHGWQVRLYMWALSKMGQFASIDGEVQYRSYSVEILAAQFGEADVKRIVDTLALVGAEEIPPRTPSVDECQFCNILGCPDRAVTKTIDATGLF